MIPSDEKVRQMILKAFRALEAEAGAKLLNPEAARRAIKNGIDSGVDILRAIDRTATEKISSLSRKVQPGTKEWDELYYKYVSEERKKRGV